MGKTVFNISNVLLLIMKLFCWFMIPLAGYLVTLSFHLRAPTLGDLGFLHKKKTHLEFRFFSSSILILAVDSFSTIAD